MEYKNITDQILKEMTEMYERCDSIMSSFPEPPCPPPFQELNCDEPCAKKPRHDGACREEEETVKGPMITPTKCISEAHVPPHLSLDSTTVEDDYRDVVRVLQHGDRVDPNGIVVLCPECVFCPRCSNCPNCKLCPFHLPPPLYKKSTDSLFTRAGEIALFALACTTTFYVLNQLVGYKPSL